jgi:DNA-binding NtrC family response regulator
VVILAEHFCRVLNDRFGFRKRIGPEALAILRGHAWPGNVRELLHVVEAAMVLCEGQEVGPEHLPATLRPAASASSAVPTASGGRVPTLEELERAHIAAVLDATKGHRGNAAQMLGISERNLYRKLREYGLLS